MNRKKILGISGSTKKNSTNELILRTIGDLFKEEIDLNLFDGVDKLPHFNPDLDNENLPSEVEAFRAQIHDADGVLFCTPEYVFSMPGSLKNAIEWNVSTTLFSSKPVAIIVASASGEKAFESLKLVMTTIEGIVDPSCTLLIKGAKGKVKGDGIIQSETLDQLKKLMDSFIKIMDNKDQIPTKYNAIN